jgi:hypothetical protein
LDLDYDNDVPDSPEINSFISSLHNQAIKMTPILQQTGMEENLTFEKTGDNVINTFTCSGKNNGRHNNIEIHPGQISAMYNPLQDIKLGSIVEMQAMDPEISRTIKILQSKHKVPNFLKKYRLRGASLLIKQDKDKQRIVLPEKAIVRIAGELHILCHSSAKKLDKIINRYFCGKNVRKICTKITGACNFCQRRLPNKCYDAYQGIMPIASRPMQIMSMDFIKLSKHLYVGSKKYVSILNIVDYYSDFCIPRLVQSETTNETIRVMNECKTFLGLFDTTMYTDNQSCYISRQFEEYCKQQGIKHVTTIPYASTGNSKIENKNDQVRSIFSIVMSSTPVNAEIGLMLSSLALNSMPKGTGKSTDITPYEAVFHRAPMNFNAGLMQHVPDEIKCKETMARVNKLYYEINKKKVENHKQKQEEYPRAVRLVPGQLVLLQDRSKIRADKQLPIYSDEIYKIIQRHGQMCKIEDVNELGTEKRVHVKHLKQYNLKSDEIFKMLTRNQLRGLGEMDEEGDQRERWHRLEAEDWSSLASETTCTQSEHSSVSQGGDGRNDTDITLPQQSRQGSQTNSKLDGKSVNELSVSDSRESREHNSEDGRMRGQMTDVTEDESKQEQEQNEGRETTSEMVRSTTEHGAKDKESGSEGEGSNQNQGQSEHGSQGTECYIQGTQEKQACQDKPQDQDDNDSQGSDIIESKNDQESQRSMSKKDQDRQTNKSEIYSESSIGQGSSVTGNEKELRSESGHDDHTEGSKSNSDSSKESGEKMKKQREIPAAKISKNNGCFWEAGREK